MEPNRAMFPSSPLETSMFWAVILVIVLVIVGASWLAGTMISKRSGGSGPRQRMTRQEQINAAKLSGAFPVRKEDR
jgi:Sec-independent protein translocase protein TatA